MSNKLSDELKVLEKMTDDQIDLSDIPLKLDWNNAEIGKFYRPVKKLVSFRIDADLLAWLKKHAGAKSYSSMINKILRRYILALEKQNSD